MSRDVAIYRWVQSVFITVESNKDFRSVAFQRKVDR